MTACASATPTRPARAGPEKLWDEDSLGALFDVSPRGDWREVVRSSCAETMRALAEEKGFEPLVPFGTAVFKASGRGCTRSPSRCRSDNSRGPRQPFRCTGVNSDARNEVRGKPGQVVVVARGKLVDLVESLEDGDVARALTRLRELLTTLG